MQTLGKGQPGSSCKRRVRSESNIDSPCGALRASTQELSPMMGKSVMKSGEYLSYSQSPSLNTFKGAKLPHTCFKQRRSRDPACKGLSVHAVLQQDRRRQDSSVQADAASRSETRHQVTATAAAVDSYVPLDQAQDILSDVVDANTPAPPILLRFCNSGQQVMLFQSKAYPDRT